MVLHNGEWIVAAPSSFATPPPLSSPAPSLYAPSLRLPSQSNQILVGFIISNSLYLTSNDVLIGPLCLTDHAALIV